MIILPALLMVFSLYFFRDPDRISPRNEKAVLSPADGRVLFVKDVFETKFIKGKAKQVSIFMSPLSVHVNRIPIDGKIEFLKYHEGKYYAAFKDKASEMNERAEFGIVNKYGKIFFTQVAGFIARRIIYEVELGDTVKAGERFGMIKFGSRVDVVVPSSWRANVQKDDDVKAGESILFEFVED
jgi:phosphatidylserine decarboxylase